MPTPTVDPNVILDAELTDATGETARTGDRIAGAPAVLVFVRHFG